MATFADLMALMMCFFVLLFSFSQIDETKYRMMVDSMSKGFGSETTIRRASMASPTMGTPSAINSRFNQFQAPSRSSRSRNRVLTTQAAASTASRVKLAVQQDLENGRISVEVEGNTVIIRLPEEVAFPSGSDAVSPEIVDIIDRLAPAMRESEGVIMVTGHTDDRPIASSKFSSNWELSADRAVSVIEEIMKYTGINQSRFAAVGHGSTKPIAPNDTPENRAKNRRVDIRIVEKQDAR